jgi:hypothetical protein
VGDRAGVVEAGPDCHQGAPVVPGQGEPVVAERAGQGDDVGGHGPFGVGDAVRVGRLVTGAVAAQVGNDDGVVGGQVGGHVPPHQMGLREAVQQHDRPARTADRHVEGHVGGDRDALIVESVDGECHAGDSPAR